MVTLAWRLQYASWIYGNLPSTNILQLKSKNITTIWFLSPLPNLCAFTVTYLTFTYAMDLTICCCYFMLNNLLLKNFKINVLRMSWMFIYEFILSSVLGLFLPLLVSTGGYFPSVERIFLSLLIVQICSKSILLCFLCWMWFLFCLRIV